MSLLVEALAGAIEPRGRGKPFGRVLKATVAGS